MPKDLARQTQSRPLSGFYTDIHRRMIESEGAGVRRPTAREFGDALQRFAIPAGDLALDAGCGATLTFAAACAGRGFRRVQALDLNIESLRVAQTVAARDGQSRVTLCAGSVLDLPYGDCRFDFVVCSGVAHHTPAPERAIGELARVMKPGAHLYVSLYCFADSMAEWFVRGLRRAGNLVSFGTMHRLFGRSRLINNFVLDHMYVPLLWVFRADEVRDLLAAKELDIVAEWPSAFDPFAGMGRAGQVLTGDGLMRVWLCRKR
jgi:SAM-dependent methyltransferase